VSGFAGPFVGANMRNLGALLLIACLIGNFSGEAKAAQAPPTLEKQLSDLEARVKKLESDLSVTKFSYGFRINTLEGKDSVNLEASQTGFSLLRTPFGTMTVDYTRAAPYVDGYELTVGFGNLTSATFNGIKIIVEYGPPLAKDASGNSTSDQYSAYYAGRKMKQFDLTTVFPPGRKTFVKLPITQVRPEEVSEVSLSGTFDNVSLVVGPQP
jgi:hypothetical protein